MDTELDTTPRRIGMDWAVRMEKPAFIGRAALERTAKLDDHRRWMGFTMDGQAPTEGSPILADGEIVGNVTGSWTSPLLGKALVLGWQRGPRSATASRSTAARPSWRRRRSTTRRATVPALERLHGIRVVADPAVDRRAGGRPPGPHDRRCGSRRTRSSSSVSPGRPR